MKNVNVLLLAMSTLPKNIEQDNYYQYQNEDGSMSVFPARSQLEPITHMLSNKLGERGEKLDKIIILETEATRKETEEKPSAVTFYKERVALFAQEIEYDDILIKEDEPAEGIKEAIDAILQKYKECNGEMELWIDTQGGFRDIVMVFTAIISLLREQRIEAKGIYSIRFSNSTKENPCPIIDQTEKYKIFKFVSAMQEFMDFGKATGLKKYYDEKDSFVQAIDKIADAIQMCHPQMFEEAIRGLAAYLKSEQEKIKDSYLQIFVDFIKKDYGELLKNPENTREQIKWCVRKEFYQQAMTIYTEKMPQYYCYILGLEVDLDQTSSYGKNLYMDAFYTNWFNEMLKKTDEIFTGTLTDLLKHDDLNDKQNTLAHLREESEKTENGIVREGILRLMKYLQCNYDRNGELLKSQSENEPKKVESYIKSLCSDRDKRNKYLHGCSLKNIEVYTKKVLAIKAAKEINPQYAKIMEHYMAIKLLRNRMNHANSEKDEGNENIATEFLREDGIDIGFEIVKDGARMDYQKIKKLIVDGVDCFN